MKTVQIEPTSFGSHSAAGCRYAERMMTAIQTLRLRKQSVIDFLTDNTPSSSQSSSSFPHYLTASED